MVLLVFGNNAELCAPVAINSYIEYVNISVKHLRPTNICSIIVARLIQCRTLCVLVHLHLPLLIHWFDGYSDALIAISIINVHSEDHRAISAPCRLVEGKELLDIILEINGRGLAAGEGGEEDYQE